MEKNKKMAITDMLEKLAEDMCDNYCKYAGQEDVQDICDNCPLTVMI